MIKIKELAIENYRSCLNTELKLDDHLTALIGANGSGKTNILSSLMLLSRRKNIRSYFDKDEDENPNLLTTTLNLKISIEDGDIEKIYSLRAEFKFDIDDSNTDSLSSLALWYKKGSVWVELEDYFLEITRRYPSPKAIDTILHWQEEYPDKKEKKNKMTKDEVIDLMLILESLSNITYYSATQFSNPSKCPVVIEIEDSRIKRSLRADPTHSKFLHDLYALFQNDKKSFNKYLNLVNKHGMALVDTIDFKDYKLPNQSYEVFVGGKLNKKKIDKKIIIPLVAVDGQPLSFNQLSEGTFKTLALVFYILSDDSDIMLVEEPEVCVHHGLLSSIIALLLDRASTMQTIISTHSDYVLDQIKPENLVLVNKQKEGGTIARSLSSSLSENNYEALKDYLSHSGNLGEYWKEGGFDYEN